MVGQVDDSYRVLAASYVRGKLCKLRQHIEGASASEGVEHVHQARVASRRLRTALRVFAGCFPGKDVKRWRKELRRAARALGPARDRDVQIAFVSDVLSGLEDRRIRPGVRRLLLRLEQERDALQAKVVKAAEGVEASGVIRDMMGEVGGMLLDLESRKVEPRSEFAYARGEEHIRRRLDELLAQEGCISDPDDQAAHHRMRISAKRLRYAMEMFAEAYDGGLDEAIDAAKRMQTLLGEIHDCDVWAGQLVEFGEAELARTVEYYGHARPFSRLRPGIEYMKQERREHRERVFAEAAAYWDELRARNFWQDLGDSLRSCADQSAHMAGRPKGGAPRAC